MPLPNTKSTVFELHCHPSWSRSIAMHPSPIMNRMPHNPFRNPCNWMPDLTIRSSTIMPPLLSPGTYFPRQRRCASAIDAADPDPCAHPPLLCLCRWVALDTPKKFLGPSAYRCFSCVNRLVYLRCVERSARVVQMPCCFPSTAMRPVWGGVVDPWFWCLELLGECTDRSSFFHVFGHSLSSRSSELLIFRRSYPHHLSLFVRRHLFFSCHR